MSGRSGYRILVPICDETLSPELVPLAGALLGNRPGEIVLIGAVTVPEGRSLSEGAAQARVRRRTCADLRTRYADLPIRVKPRIRVGYAPWHEVAATAGTEGATLLLVPWDGDPKSQLLGVPIENLLAETPCDIALARGSNWRRAKRILQPLRGGPYSALSVSLALTLAESNAGEITVLHAQSPNGNDGAAEAFLPMLRHLPHISQIVIGHEDVASSIVSHAETHDVIVMGASSRAGETLPRPLGPIAAQVARETHAELLVVKSAGAEATLDEESDSVYRDRALSIVTDKWFAENTFDADEFADLRQLVAIKQERGLTISLGLPALNEEETVGNVIGTIRDALMEEFPVCSSDLPNSLPTSTQTSLGMH